MFSNKFFKLFSLVYFFNAVSGRLDWATPNEALDQDLYERAIDPELCHEHVRYIMGDSILTLQCKYLLLSLIFIW